MNKNMKLAAGCALLSLSAPVAAHVGAVPAEGFGFGLQHPLLGLDHFLVMTGLGLWLSRQRLGYGLCGTAAFLAAMTGGAAAAMYGWFVPYVETAILLSVLLTGALLLAPAGRVPGGTAMAAIAAMASLHGQAHGSEMPLQAEALFYCAGFLLATLALLVAGLSCGRLLRYWHCGGFSRIYGGLSGIAGLYLLLHT